MAPVRPAGLRFFDGEARQVAPPAARAARHHRYVRLQPVRGEYQQEQRAGITGDRLVCARAVRTGWEGCARRSARGPGHDRVALAGYLGRSDAFDQAIADFAETYADQNERDYAAFQAAAKEGKVEATTEI